MSKKRIFAEEHPEYLKYWDFEKNTLDPYKIGPMCNEKAYWKCEHGHRFERMFLICLEETQPVQNAKSVQQWLFQNLES